MSESKTVEASPFLYRWKYVISFIFGFPAFIVLVLDLHDRVSSVENLPSEDRVYSSSHENVHEFSGGTLGAIKNMRDGIEDGVKSVNGVRDVRYRKAISGGTLGASLCEDICSSNQNHR